MRPAIPLIIPFILLFSGCGTPAPEVDPGAVSGGETHAHAEGHHHGSGDPMPMIAIMRQLSVDLANLTHALWLEDFDAMRESSAAIAHHPPIAADDVARMQGILGAEWAGFEEADHAVHEGAEELHKAVESGDLDAVLDRLASLQRGCVACHTSWRDRLLSEGSTVKRR